MENENKTKNSKNKIKIFLVILIVLVLVVIGYFIFNKINNISISEDIDVVATLVDEITSNSAWCGTFQLVWNDMQNYVVGQDIVFTPQIQMATNLNKQTFTEDDISEEYYFKIYGLKTLNLKEEIENGIKEKFDQESDILDKVDWNDAPQDDSGYSDDYRRYLFYVMLYREFTFESPFDKLDNDNFEGTIEEYSDIEYFGIDGDSSSDLYSQVEVLYYNSENDCAVRLTTNEGDLVVLAKGNNGTTFEEIYENILKKEESYDGESDFTEYDILKVPNIDFNIEKSFDELKEAGKFYSVDDDICEIENAMQSIEFLLDETGGTIKSEAFIDIVVESEMVVEIENEYRYFEFDSTYNLFLVENGKDKPYLALNIDDITLFQ